MNFRTGCCPPSTGNQAAYITGCSLIALVVLTGCGRPKAKFEANKLAARVIERSLGVERADLAIARVAKEGSADDKKAERARTQERDEQREKERQLDQGIVEILEAMFGTPDEPYFVASAEAGTDGFVDIDNLIRAAGPVSRDQTTADPNADAADVFQGEGLFRQHCVHCHGITGNGKGPTAVFLNPYPRDFTKAQFKFSSTIKGIPPTNDDLHRILMNGIEGTAMPSFALLDRGEIEALIDYVKYLSVRGQMERALVEEAADLEEISDGKENLVDDKLATIVGQWKSATSVEPPEPNVPLFSEDREGWSEEESAALFDSIDRGRRLYYTADANCFSCHGPTQLGDGELTGYDDWNKELYDWVTVKDPNGSNMAEHLGLGGLPPRNIRPRNLRLGQYRGGRRPLDIFWRIHNGIDGTTMPNATLKPEGVPNAKGLTYDDVWDLINFVLSVPYERLSRPGLDLPTNARIRS